MTFFCERLKFCSMCATWGFFFGNAKIRQLQLESLLFIFSSKSTQHMLMTTFEMKYLVYQITAFDSLKRRNSCIEPPEMHLNFIIITLCILCLLHNTIKLTSQAFYSSWQLKDCLTNCSVSASVPNISLYVSRILSPLVSR